MTLSSIQQIKNLGFSINHTQWYINEYQRQLADTGVYHKKAYADIENIIRIGHRDLNEIKDKYNCPQITEKYNLNILGSRNIEDIKLPTLNIMPKVHKLKNKASKENEHELKGRPIVNGFTTINTEPSKLLGEIFHKCLLDLVAVFDKENIHCPIVDSSKQVVNRLSQVNLNGYNPDCIYFVTFDFSSLYTSIKTWTVCDTIHFLGAILKLGKGEINLMKDLFKFIKQNAHFTVANKELYLQKEGFAMGSYDSCDGANLVLLKAEYFMLQNKRIRNIILDFFRFIDDGSMVIHIDPNEINEFIACIAYYYPKELEIEFSVTKFKTVFLDLTYRTMYIHQWQTTPPSISERI